MTRFVLPVVLFLATCCAPAVAQTSSSQEQESPAEKLESENPQPKKSARELSPSAEPPSESGKQVPRPPATPSEKRPLPELKVGETISLFDGETLHGWVTANDKPVTQGWTVTDGAIHRAARGGNIYYAQQVGDFDLSFEWKIPPGGNNGLKYRVRRYGGRMLGCEYQILGEKKPNFSRGSCGALYALYEPGPNKRVHQAPEWNRGRIVAQGGKIEHWINGERIVEADLGSPEWRERLEASKFAPHDDFARNTTGRLMLTDHGSPVWFRDLNLTPLPAKSVPPIAPDPADLLYVVKPIEQELAEKYHLDPTFYKKNVSVQNIVIATSDRVSDVALREAAYQFDKVMRSINPQVAQRIRDKEVLCILIGHDELTSQLPQFRTDKTGNELDFYNWRRRGFLTHKHGRPTVVFAEEDVLEYEGGMQEESILIHEFGHVIDGAGFDDQLRERLTQTFENAQKNMLWQDGRAAQRFRRVRSKKPVLLLDALAEAFPHQSRKMLAKYLDAGDILVNGKPTDAQAMVTRNDKVLIVFGGPKACYASKNRAEYWAEGVQCWYNTNRTMDHDHNHIHTRDQLKAYDAMLARLCKDVLGDSNWRFASPRTRAGRDHLKHYKPADAPEVKLAPHIQDAANDYYDKYWRDYWQRLEEKHARAKDVEEADGSEGGEQSDEGL